MPLSRVQVFDVRCGRGTLAHFYRLNFTTEYVHGDLNQRDTNEEQEEVGVFGVGECESGMIRLHSVKNSLSIIESSH